MDPTHTVGVTNPPTSTIAHPNPTVGTGFQTGTTGTSIPNQVLNAGINATQALNTGINPTHGLNAGINPTQGLNTNIPVQHSGIQTVSGNTVPYSATAMTEQYLGTSVLDQKTALQNVGSVLTGQSTTNQTFTHSNQTIGTAIGTGLATTGLNQNFAGTGANQNLVGAGVNQIVQPAFIEPGNRIGLRDNDNVLPSHTVPGNTTAQGQFIFRPREGRFVKDKDPIGKMDPYCKIKLGWHRGKTAVARSEGTNPTWADAIALPRKHNETFAKIKIKDKDRTSLNDRIGEVKINLDEIVSRGKVSQWYPVQDRKGLPAGELLLDIEYSPIFMK